MGTFLPNIYVFYKTRFCSFKMSFQKFQQLRKKYAMYTFELFFLIMSNGLDNKEIFNELRVQFSTISANISKISLFFLARPFENYCELNISCRYDVELGNKITYSLCTAWKVVASKACDSANSGASMARIKETMGTELEKRRSYMLAK
jgi:hypothetical protein